MALEFERNINLEEIDSDALFGITYLKDQTLAQKVIFFGSAIASVGLYIFTQMYLEWSFVSTFLISAVVGCVGFLFGANQCEYLTIIEYLRLILFKPIKYANYASTEDIGLMKKDMELIKVEETKKQKEIAEATPEGQKRMLILVVGLIVGFIVLALVLMGISSSNKGKMTHHTVGYIAEEYSMYT